MDDKNIDDQKLPQSTSSMIKIREITFFAVQSPYPMVVIETMIYHNT